MMNSDKAHAELPVMYSECNLVFESDADYIRHYSDKHKPTGKNYHRIKLKNPYMHNLSGSRFGLI
jgi:hypothetical protein